MDQPTIVDQNGQERDWSWLVANFGPISIERAPATSGTVFRIVKLRDSEGPSVQVVSVRDAEGMPVIGTNVIRYWPDAPQLPDWAQMVSRWRPRGVVGPTNEDGNVGFGMGGGDYYFAPNAGASALWLGDPRGPSDFISGLGMLGGTNHRHIDVFYAMVDADDGNGNGDNGHGEPPPGQWQMLLDKLDRIIELLEQR